jgi:hypothetical protein
MAREMIRHMTSGEVMVVDRATGWHSDTLHHTDQAAPMWDYHLDNALEDGGELSAEEWQVIRAGQDPVSVCGTAGGHHAYVAIFPYTDKLRQYWRCSRCRRVAT